MKFFLIVAFLFSLPAMSAVRCLDNVIAPVRFREWLALSPAENPIPKTPIHLPMLVIGAGPAGLAAAANLRKRGIDYVQVEAFREIGGLWNSKNAQSPAYDSLVMNSSRATTYLDAEEKVAETNYMNREQALDYLNRFAQRHDLLPQIAFNRKVKSVSQGSQREWIAEFETSESAASLPNRFRGIVIATGFHQKPNRYLPEALVQQCQDHQLPFSHSSDYRNPTPFVGKNVLIVGLGNSGADIAQEVSRVTAKTAISSRNIPWIVPLWALGNPADQLAQSTPDWVPHWVNLFGFQLLQKLYVGNLDHPNGRANHGILDKLPVTDRGITEAVKSGRVSLRTEISQIDQNGISFADSKAPPEVFDHVIFATGFRRRFDYLPSDLLRFEDPSFSLLYQVFHREESGIFAMNELTVPQGVWPVFALQSELIGSYLEGESMGLPRIDEFNRRRHSLNPNFKGEIFSQADEHHVNFKIYQQFSRKLAAWLLSRDNP